MCRVLPASSEQSFLAIPKVWITVIFLQLSLRLFNSRCLHHHIYHDSLGVSIFSLAVNGVMSNTLEVLLSFLLLEKLHKRSAFEPSFKNHHSLGKGNSRAKLEAKL